MVKHQFDTIAVNSETGILETDAINDLAASMLRCNADFIGIDCEMSTVEMVSIQAGNGAHSSSPCWVVYAVGAWLLLNMIYQ